MENLNSGGGYIDTLQRLKAKAIRTPLKLHIEWNNKVNNCNSLKELKTLIINKFINNNK
tara:strand:+ start:66 stop:242 length:177 start_codon:yes stop_codon:yes gene_type:complete